MASTISAPVDPQDLSATYSAFLYKISNEGLHNVYSVGGFVVICLFVALMLLMLCNFLAYISCRKSPDKKKITNVAPPKRSQTVYSSMLPPREDFVVVDMDVVMNSMATETSGQVVQEKPAPKGKGKKKAVKKRAADIRRIRLAKKLRLNITP